jgi:hypothetical protein
VLVPVAILATGSSVFEEVVFRGILLHALVAKARWPAGLAAVLTSALFGWMHLKNDEGHPHGAIYAGWTFLGGLVFSASYLGTQGGLIAPIALHFGLNAIIFGDSVLRVGAKLWEDRQGFLAVSSRFEQSRAARRVAGSALAAGNSWRQGRQIAHLEPHVRYQFAVDHGTSSRRYMSGRNTRRVQNCIRG